jgi:hypothetical protein
MSSASCYVYGSRLEFKRKKCIWCRRRLIQSGLTVDCSEDFGPRPRSEEHIIPKSIFGRFVTNDLCKCCNDHFGAVADHALVRDNHIVEAAKLVGFKESDLWPFFDTAQVTPRGRTITVSYKEGEFRPQPSLKNLNELSLPIIEGKLDEKQVKHFAARLKTKVMAKGLRLSEEQVKNEIEGFIAKMRADPKGTYTNSVIGETVEPTQLGTQLKYTRETKPWETHWALTKIVFEFSQLFWPQNYRQYYSPLLNAWRDFLNRREVSEDGKTGPGIFIQDLLPKEQASKRHFIEGTISPTHAEWTLTFFGTARWKIGVDQVEPITPPPDPPLRFEIINPVDPAEGEPQVMVSLLGNRPRKEDT